jgi:hypothetical protein
MKHINKYFLKTYVWQGLIKAGPIIIFFDINYWMYISCVIWNAKRMRVGGGTAILVTGCECQQGYETSTLTYLLENWLSVEGEVLALHNDHPPPP